MSLIPQTHDTSLDGTDASTNEIDICYVSSTAVAALDPATATVTATTEASC